MMLAFNGRKKMNQKSEIQFRHGILANQESNFATAYLATGTPGP